MIAIIALSLSKSFAFFVFFKCWLAIVVYGLLYGLVLLPLILSLIGPPSTNQNQESNEYIETLNTVRPLNYEENSNIS